MKLDILAFAAHPDDVELACSATVIKHIQIGKKVGIVDLTRGELGTRGSGQLRLEEAAQSAKVMGLSVRENAGLADGFFDLSKENKLTIIRYIRKYQPEIILCNATKDRHPDHERAGKLVNESSFLSGLIKVETMLDGVEQAPWRPNAIYHYIQDRYIKPDMVVEVSEELMKKKMEAIFCFKSQFFNPHSDEPETPISSKAFIEFIEARCREMGREIHAEFAEGFTIDRAIGIDSFFDIK
ncbi:MAG: bacillithiol biosynthesis deacetylase BshB1 [Chitinophagales bacterium]|nr:bacillithiol biosynthesis deacetylase BshB1 [Chitinophagales bacterium]